MTELKLSGLVTNTFASRAIGRKGDGQEAVVAWKQRTLGDGRRLNDHIVFFSASSFSSMHMYLIYNQRKQTVQFFFK